MGKKKKIAILGGGIAGLSCAYAALRKQMPFCLYEAEDRFGGNAMTLESGDFYFDSGAHRLHDKIPEVTKTIRHLLKGELKKINAPSRIFLQGQSIDFPLSPLNLIKKLPPATLMKGGLDYLCSKLKTNGACDNLADYAIKRFGKTIAHKFVLDYSEKLWGAPCNRLSPSTAGKRLTGLSIKTLLIEALYGPNEKTKHLDGEFYYPKNGIGRIGDSLVEVCPKASLKTGAKITGIKRDFKKIIAIEINHQEVIPVEHLISTLPLSHCLKLLDPLPPKQILELCDQLRFRHVIVVALFLNKDSVSQYASSYFPEKQFPFTRVHEPKRRCDRMAPEGKTSLVAEIPCQGDEEIWGLDDASMADRVIAALKKIHWITDEEILSQAVHRMPYAYPIIEVGAEKKVEIIFDWISTVKNLKLLGRSSTFLYYHIHDIMNGAFESIEQI